jgi:hypothetical protein
MSQTLDPVIQHHVRQAADRLADEFKGIYSEQSIERYIAESLDLLGSPGSTSSFLCLHTASPASGFVRLPSRRECS